jgi:hypothetical protein
MSTATPSSRPPTAAAEPVAAAAAAATAGRASDAIRLVATRIGLWVGLQLLLAGLLILTGSVATGEALNSAAAWWMVYAVLVDLGTLIVIFGLLRRDRLSYRSLLGPPAAVWQIALGALGVLAATMPAVAFSTEVNEAFYGDQTPPFLAVIDVPPLASIFSLVVVTVLTEFAEPVAYLGVILPRLERLLGRSWLAATIVVLVWAGEHAFFPLLITDGRLDLTFAVYRVVSVLPFLAIWTALYYAIGRRLLPIMAARWIFNGGTALALALGQVA